MSALLESSLLDSDAQHEAAIKANDFQERDRCALWLRKFGGTQA